MSSPSRADQWSSREAEHRQAESDAHLLFWCKVGFVAWTCIVFAAGYLTCQGFK